jgi:hypothetical protein
MTRRILSDPNYLPPEPTLVEIRQALIDIWSITSIFVSRETLDYSITGNVSHEVIIMANSTSKTVGLRAEPEDGHRVTVIRTDGEVVIDGNGKNINDSSTLCLTAAGDAPMMIFSQDDDTWWTA